MRFPTWYRAVILTAVLVTAGAGATAAQQRPEPSAPPRVSEADQGPTGVPIYFRGVEIGRVFVSNGSFTPEERAHGVETRLNHEILEVGVRSDEVTVVHDTTASRILGAGRLLVLVTDADAQAVGRDRRALTEELAQTMRGLIAETNEEFEPRQVMFSGLRSLGVLVIGAGAAWLLVRLTRPLLKRIQGWRVHRFGGVDVGSSQMASRLSAMAAGALRAARAVAIAAVVLVTLERVMSLLPWTRPYASLVARYLADPVDAMWHSFIDYLPKAGFLFAIGAATYVLLTLLKLLFSEISRG